jgi:D-alanyl-D-alanine endopeptidase (penicillin-binding protein 7)
MKKPSGSSSRAWPTLARSTATFLVASLALAASLAVPLSASATAAVKTKHAHHPAAEAKTAVHHKSRSAKVEEQESAGAAHFPKTYYAYAYRVQVPAPGRVHGSRRISARLYPHSRREVSRVAFEPAKPTEGQAFGLRENNEGSLALRSSVAYVVDQNSLAPLYDKNSQAVLPIASITKLMTAMVAIDAKLPMNDLVEVTDEDRDYNKGTGSRLSVGSVLSRQDMLHIALMASENRAAAALSRYYPGGRPAFLNAMNLKARSLGMMDTHFESPTGLTSQNVSSARDLVKMVNAAYQYPLIREFSTDHSYEVFTGKTTLHYNSTNALVRNPTWDIGLQKTGFINEAGECLVMQTVIHSRPMIIVLLDSTGKYSHFADATRLRAWLDTGGVQKVTSADNGHSGT